MAATVGRRTGQGAKKMCINRGARGSLEINLAADCLWRRRIASPTEVTATGAAGDRRRWPRDYGRGGGGGECDGGGGGGRRCSHDNVAIMYPFTSSSVRAAAAVAVATTTSTVAADDGRQSIVALPDGGGPSDAQTRTHTRAFAHKHKGAHTRAQTHGNVRTHRTRARPTPEYMPLPWLLCLPPRRGAQPSADPGPAPVGRGVAGRSGPTAADAAYTPLSAAVR